MPSRFINEIDNSLIERNTVGEREVVAASSEKYYNENSDDFKLGDLIDHETFGHGVIINISGDILSRRISSYDVRIHLLQLFELG